MIKTNADLPPARGGAARGASAAAPAGAAIHLALITVQLCFASFSTVGKIALRGLPAMELAAIRVTVAALVFALIWLVVGRERVSRGDLLRTAVYAFFGVTANQLLFVSGLVRTTATNAVVLGASIPVFTVGVALLLGRERATRLKLAGLALALFGALGLTGAGHFEAGGAALSGNALILCNSFSYSIYLVISRDILFRLRPLTVVTLTFVFGALGVDLFLVAAGALHAVPFDTGTFLRSLPLLDTRTLEALGYIVLFPTVCAYLLNALALRAVPASLVAVYIYAQPVVGALLAAAILGERPTAGTGLAAVLIFGGIWLVGVDSRRGRRLAAARAEKNEAT